MDGAQRNKQVVLDADSGRPGALMAALDPDVEYTLMGSTHRFARAFLGRDDVAQNLFAALRAVPASGRMTPVNAVVEGDQVVVELEGTATDQPVGSTRLWPIPLKNSLAIRAD